ncbi:MAG: hypothetical protein ACFFCE_02850 [Promethearchaeota archaeon]
MFNFAQKSGVNEQEILDAIKLAKKARKHAISRMDKFISTFLESNEGSVKNSGKSGCCS